MSSVWGKHTRNRIMGHNSNCKWLLLVEYNFFFIAESPNFSDSFIEVDIFWKQIYLFWRFGIWRLLRRKLFLGIIGVVCLVSRCTISICKYRSLATQTEWTHLLIFLSYRYHTVNQRLFATTFFHDFTRVNWFGATNFCDQILSTPVFFYNSLANTGPWREIFMMMRLIRTWRNFYCMWMKVGLQYLKKKCATWILKWTVSYKHTGKSWIS